MKDCIVGCATNYDWSKLKYWVNSINASGFEGDKVLILMNCDKDTVQKVTDAGFSVIAFNKDAQGNLTYNSQLMVHVERFIHIYRLLKDNQYRYVITTDVRDVIFQKNPVDWIVVCIYFTNNISYTSSRSSICFCRRKINIFN